MATERPSGGDLDDLLQRACGDLRDRLRAGRPCAAEALLAAFPALAADPHRGLALVLTELEARRARGEHSDPADWLRRFPQYADALRDRLDTPAPVESGWSDCPLDTTDPRTEVHVSAVEPGEGPVGLLGPHEVGEILGQGGMGVVYRARDLALGRPVALKRIRAGALAGPDEVQRFYREARAAARLRHPHIVPIHELGLFEGQHCFTMDLIAGGNLARHRDGFHNPRAAAALLMKVAAAVEHAHGRGVIHRDLKPGNILLDEAGAPLVSDFGLAKVVDGPADLTRAGEVVGTPAYMAPEQAEGRPEAAGVRSDVWALGVILYELVTGRRPFPGESSREVLAQVQAADPPRPRALRRDLDRRLEAVILKCLEKEPGRRYESAAELADDLGRWLRGEPVQARPVSWLRRLGRRLRRPTLVAVPVLLLAVVVAAVAPARRAPADAKQRAEAQALAAIQTDLERLNRREPVTLIGATGGPNRVRWVDDEGLIERGTVRDDAFSFSTLGFAMLELLPAVPPECYRLRAEVRHDSAGGWEGEVGLFVLHHRVNESATRAHVVWNLTIKDGRGSNPRQLALRAYRFHKDSRGRSLKDSSGPLALALKTPVRLTTGPWHRLAFEVRPQGLRTFLDGKPVSALDRARMEWNIRTLFDFRPSLPPASPSGSLGLIVRRSTGSFRNVVVEPLNE